MPFRQRTLLNHFWGIATVGASWAICVPGDALRASEAWRQHGCSKLFLIQTGTLHYPTVATLLAVRLAPCVMRMLDQKNGIRGKRLTCKDPPSASVIQAK